MIGSQYTEVRYLVKEEIGEDGTCTRKTFVSVVFSHSMNTGDWTPQLLDGYSRYAVRWLPRCNSDDQTKVIGYDGYFEDRQIFTRHTVQATVVVVDGPPEEVLADEPKIQWAE